MTVESWISFCGALITIGVFVGMTKAQDRTIDKIEKAVDAIRANQGDYVKKSDFRELAREVRGRSTHEE